MAKEPRPGRVKTRLARDIGSVAAAWWFRHQLARIAREMRGAPGWRTIIAVTPDRTAGDRCWPRELPRRPQGQGDLGARMARALGLAGPGPVLVVGADVPGLDRRRIAAALKALCGRDAVLGPATDGGYWLIGRRAGARPLPESLFRGVRWSSPNALEDTVATLGGLRIGWAETLDDVDTADDLARSLRAARDRGDPAERLVTIILPGSAS